MNGFLLLVFLSSAIFFGCSNQNPVSITGSQNSTVATTATQWNAMTQSQKDLTLSSAAVADNNNYVGVQCLAWVQAVVPRASGGVVNIPTFMDWPYEYQLKAPNTAHVVNRNVTDIKNVQLMDIVQMYWYPRAAKGKIRAWDPHTAFVLRKTATSMDFLDCLLVLILSACIL